MALRPGSPARLQALYTAPSCMPLRASTRRLATGPSIAFSVSSKSVTGRKPPLGLAKFIWSARLKRLATIPVARCTSVSNQYASCAHVGKSSKNAVFHQEGPGRENLLPATIRARSCGDSGRTKSPQGATLPPRSRWPLRPAAIASAHLSTHHSTGSVALMQRTRRGSPGQGDGLAAHHWQVRSLVSTHPATETACQEITETSWPLHRTSCSDCFGPR